MPRIALPKGDLPVFPSAAQYAGTTEVTTQRPRESRPRPSNHERPLVAPPNNTRPSNYRPPAPNLHTIFAQADTDRLGYLSPKELSNAFYSIAPLSVDTIAIMFKLFPRIQYPEFERLHSYVMECMRVCHRSVDYTQFSDALNAFGYRLSTSFVQFLFKYHDRGMKELSLDVFIQACLTLRLLTDVFKRFDTDQDGVITIGFEDFISAIVKVI